MPTDLPKERAVRPTGSLELDPAAGEDVAPDETERLIASSKVVGTAVYDGAGERLGTLRDVMLDKLTGQVAYAVLSSGGLLGLGERYHPLPWRALRYSVELGGYVVEGDPEAPEHATGGGSGPEEPAAVRPSVAV